MTPVIEFTGSERQVMDAQCQKCRHYQGGVRCCAFILGHIPLDIFMNRHDHHQPYPGDNGIRFEPLGS